MPRAEDRLLSLRRNASHLWQYQFIAYCFQIIHFFWIFCMSCSQRHLVGPCSWNIATSWLIEDHP
ncbi:hypothetical protein Micbo1qcDRAFT_159721, partial [Microdochium bolleyi]